MFKSNDELQAEAVVNNLKQKLQRYLNGDSCVILLVGRTGYGKSSLVNKLLNQDVAPVGDTRPTTMDIIPYECEIEGVKFKVIDTPGLCDDLEEEGNDYKYLELIRSKVEKVDSMWFFSRLDETRVSSDERRAIKLITDSFQPKIWLNAVIIFTFADHVDASKYSNKLKARTEAIQEEIKKYVKKNDVVKQTLDQIANTIPSVAVTNERDKTPDGKTWMGELYTVVFERMSRDGAAKFFMATVERIKPPEKEKETPYAASPTNNNTIDLDASQYKRVSNRTKEILEIASLTAGIGTMVGAVAGPTGAAAGGAVGAVIGFIVSYFSE